MEVIKMIIVTSIPTYFLLQSPFEPIFYITIAILVITWITFLLDLFTNRSIRYHFFLTFLCYSIFSYLIFFTPQIRLTYVQFAHDCARKSDFQCTIDFYELALKVDPDFADGYAEVGLFYEQIKQYSEAIEHYMKSIKLDKENLKGLINLANLYDTQKMKSSEEICRLLVRSRPIVERIVKEICHSTECEDRKRFGKGWALKVLENLNTKHSCGIRL